MLLALNKGVMFIGVVTNKDVLSHPFLLVRLHGIRGFIRILSRALSYKSYQFIDCLKYPRS